MGMTAKLEYRVRSAPRYFVTRFHETVDGSAGVETKGVYDSIEVACEVAYALCKAEHDKLGFAPGDDRIVYPLMHPSSAAVSEPPALVAGDDGDGLPEPLRSMSRSNNLQGKGGFLEVAMELEKAKRNLALRDKFLVEKGLWQAFSSQLPPITRQDRP